MAEQDISQVSMSIFDVSVNGVDVGFVDDIETEIKFETTPRVLKQLGSMPLGHRLTGVVPTIKGKFRQTGTAQLALFFPWCSPSGPIAMSPLALYGDLYDYARRVVLHPRYMGASPLLDRVFNRAVVATGLSQKADGKEDDALDFEMVAYPDRAAFPNIVIGNITGIQPPTVSEVSAPSGTTDGGTAVTITGSNFTYASSVTFGGTPATSFTVDSATQITAVTPAHEAALVDVVVLTPGAASAATSADQFTFVTPAPAVTGLNVSGGTTDGGTAVTITGTHFTGATAVMFGAVAATSVIVLYDTSITCVSPAHAGGEVDVKVTTPAGTSAPVAGDEYTYA